MAPSGLSSSVSQQSTCLWAGCAFLVTLGLWCATSSLSTTQTHINVRPTVQPVTRLFPHSRVPSSGPSITPTTQLAIHTSSGPLKAAVEAAAAVAGAPWLSLTAVLLGLIAILINVFKGSSSSQPTYAPMYAPAAAGAPPKSNRMDEIALATRSEQARSKDITPKQVILDLQRGNARFWSGTPERPELDAMERRALIIGQTPKVAILSCADSRVPVEIVFDQGLGSVFVVRVAGNIIDSTAMGSIEFSVKYLGVKAVLVMGHEACGAVKGAMSMTQAQVDEQPIHLQNVLMSIKNNLNVPKLQRIQDNRAQDREAVVANCSAQVKRLQDNPLIKERIANGTLIVAGAFYELSSGIVDLFTLSPSGLVVDL